MKLKLGLKKKVTEEEQEEVPASKAPLAKASWMKQGFQAANKEMANNKAKQGSFTPDFWLKDGEEAVVRFISSEPLCMYQHRVQVAGKWRTHTCLGDNCPLCEGGNKKQFVGVFSVIDRRKEEWNDKVTGKKVVRQNTVKMWRAGTRVMASLERLTAKRGSLTGYDINVSRSGESTATVYTLIPDDPSALSATDKALKPLDLVALLAPKSRQELLAGVNAGKTDDEPVAEQF
jgi:hypothetical protein